MLNFAILDDNIEIVKKLSSMLEHIILKHDFEAQITFKTTNIDKFMDFVNSNKIDVLFLDINLHSSQNGLDIAEKIRQTNKDCYFIFITAFSEFGFTAYRYKTFDFIFKPVDYDRLEDCIIRLFDDIRGPTKKFLKLDNKNTIIDEKEINFIERNGMKLVFHTYSRDYEIYSSFAKIESKLPQNFVRCHRSFIVNINNITKVEPLTNTIYFNNTFCDIGPKYKKNFFEVINNYGYIN